MLLNSQNNLDEIKGLRQNSLIVEDLDNSFVIKSKGDTIHEASNEDGTKSSVWNTISQYNDLRGRYK